MNRKITTIYSLALIAGIFFSCCREKSMDGMIIFTRISAKAPSSPTAFNTTPDGSTIIAVDSKGSQMEVLTKDFFSAASPRISFDGKCLLFTAKKNSETPWQIFEMNLENRKVRPVTSCSENCLHPAYLPGERIVFCRINKNDSLRSQSSLFSCNIDGSDLKRISFNPDTYSYPNVITDGRILTATNSANFIVMRRMVLKQNCFTKV